MNRDLGDPQDATGGPGGSFPQPAQPLVDNLRPFAAAASEHLAPVRLFRRRRINLLAWGGACVLGVGIWVMLFKLL